MKHVIIIPARIGSTRLPGKPLIDILGKSLIQRTYEQCVKSMPKERVYIATDDMDIASHCQSFGAQVVLTSCSCFTGTDRVAEAADKIDADYYINVQGDEPLINPRDIEAVERLAEESSGDIINGYAPILTEDIYRSLTVPKVVFREDGRLLYMSRSPIPGNKKDGFVKAWRQICIYAFPKAALKSFYLQQNKSPLERIEDIEILRFLEMGYDVRMLQLSGTSFPVDTPEDIEKVKGIILRQGCGY